MTLVEAFLQSLPSTSRQAWSQTTGLEAELQRIAQASRGTGVSPLELAKRTAEVVATETPRAGTLSALDAPGMALALGAVRAEPAAQQQFESLCHAEVGRVRRRLREPALEDLEQQVLELMLVGEKDHGPRLLQYGGRAPLGRWVFLVATRFALDRIRSAEGERRAAEHSSRLQTGIVHDSPELLLAKAELRKLMPDAIRAALGTLSPRQRNLLRLRFIHGMRVDEIATAKKLHRVSASRALAEARSSLHAALRLWLADHGGIPRAELDSLLRKMPSDIGMSLRDVLGSGEE